jgi:hypothetical protein
MRVTRGKMYAYHILRRFIYFIGPRESQGMWDNLYINVMPMVPQ